MKRIRARHFDILRALAERPRTTDELADAVHTSPIVADLRATELLPWLARNHDDVWTITDEGRRALLTPKRDAP